MNPPRIAFLLFAVCLANSAAAQKIDLADRPEDAAKMQLVVIGDPNDQPAVWFSKNPRLAKLREKTHFVVLPPTGQLFRERYAEKVAGTPPMVIFQRANGAIVWAADRARLASMNSDELYESMRAAYKKAAAAVKVRPDAETIISQICPTGGCPPGTNPAILPPALPTAKPPVPIAPTLDEPVEFTPRWYPTATPDPAEFLGGWFTDSINQIIWIVGAVLVAFFVLILSIVFLCVLYLLSKIMG